MRRAVAIGILAVLLLVPSVSAHANYYKSEPARGARLAEAPSRVSVTLSEPVDPKGSSLEVRTPTGERIDLADVRYERGDTPTLSVGLPADLAPGAYVAHWRALSTVDGHVTDGTWGFAFGGFEPPEEIQERDDWDPAGAAARTFAYAGYALGFGVVAFAFFIDPAGPQEARQRIRGRVLALAGLLVALGMATLFFLTVDDSGLGTSGFAMSAVGKEFVARLAIALVTLGVCAVAWWRSASRGLVAGAALLLLLGAVGHSMFAHSANKGWWASAIDLVHLIAVAVWLGGLVLLLHFILFARDHGSYEDVIRVGHRFSQVALPSVVLLGLTGIASTFLILGTHPFREPTALFTHPYGSFLAAKILLFFGMIALAGINRFVFLGQKPGPDGAARPKVYESLRPDARNPGGPFSRAVGVEATLGLAVLVLAGFLTAMSPPSALAAEGPDDSLQRIGFGQAYNVTIRIDPAPRSGTDANVSLTIREAETGRPLEEAIRVRVTLARAADGNETGGETYTATPDGNGKWLVGDVLFVEPGAYHARIEVQTEDVYRDVVTIPFEVQP